MKKPRKMSAALQTAGIGRMLAGTKWNTEMFDVHSHIDRTLHFDENRRNIEGMLGIQRRDRGSEHLQIKASERARARSYRQQNPDYQAGWSNQEIDRRYQADRPGKRHSRNGKRYYERRENRSDRGRWL